MNPGASEDSAIRSQIYKQSLKQSKTMYNNVKQCEKMKSDCGDRGKIYTHALAHLLLCWRFILSWLISISKKVGWWPKFHSWSSPSFLSGLFSVAGLWPPVCSSPCTWKAVTSTTVRNVEGILRPENKLVSTENQRIHCLSVCWDDRLGKL